MAHTLYLDEDDMMSLLLDHCGGPMTESEYITACGGENPDPLLEDIFHRVAFVSTLRNICHGRFVWHDVVHVFEATFSRKRDFDRFIKKYLEPMRVETRVDDSESA
jgi:hypothetical protein